MYGIYFGYNVYLYNGMYGFAQPYVPTPAPPTTRLLAENDDSLIYEDGNHIDLE